MGRPSSVLDGPRMGYGSGQQQRRTGVPLSTVILAIVCVVLAVLLALSLAGRQQTTSTATGASASPSPSGTDVPPAGAPDAVATFLTAWSLPPTERDNSLASVTVTGLPDTIDATTAVQLAKARAVRGPAYTRINDQTLHADQPLSDGSRLQLQLVFDQAAIYGWLITSVQLR